MDASGRALPYATHASGEMPWLRRLARVQVIATFILIQAGGIVTTKGAGLAVPDWPLSYGQFMPPRWWATGNIAHEHSHRLIAGTVAVMMLTLAVCVTCFDRRRWARGLAWAAFGTVVAQALLGGATVLILGDARAPIRVVHAFVAETFFLLTIVLAASYSRWWPAGSHAGSRAPRGARIATTATTAVLFLQLMLGALMRHTESSLALVDFPMAYEARLLPPTDAAGLTRLNDARLFDHHLDEPVTMAQTWFNFAHRAFALPAGAAVLGLVAFVFLRLADRPLFTRPAALLAGLLSVQLVLGIMTVLSLRNVWLATLHVAVGVWMLATSYLMAIRAFRMSGPKEAEAGAVRPALAGGASPA